MDLKGKDKEAEDGVRKPSFIALQLAQALASRLMFDFVLVVNWLRFTTGVRQPGEHTRLCKMCVPLCVPVQAW